MRARTSSEHGSSSFRPSVGAAAGSIALSFSEAALRCASRRRPVAHQGGDVGSRGQTAEASNPKIRFPNRRHGVAPGAYQFPQHGWPRSGRDWTALCRAYRGRPRRGGRWAGGQRLDLHVQKAPLTAPAYCRSSPAKLSVSDLPAWGKPGQVVDLVVAVAQGVALGGAGATGKAAPGLELRERLRRARRTERRVNELGPVQPVSQKTRKPGNPPLRPVTKHTSTDTRMNWCAGRFPIASWIFFVPNRPSIRRPFGEVSTFCAVHSAPSGRPKSVK